MTDRSLLLAAGVFAVSTAFGAAVSVKEDVRGEVLGIHLPGRTGVLLAAGWGSGLAAPWPMPALTLGAAICARPGVPWARRMSVSVGTAVLLGTLLEPVTWGRRSRSPLTAASVAFNLVTAVVLLTVGRKRAAATLAPS